jgi:hypothetical protein
LQLPKIAWSMCPHTVYGCSKLLKRLLHNLKLPYFFSLFLNWLLDLLLNGFAWDLYT